jgi:hypothetical protein
MIKVLEGVSQGMTEGMSDTWSNNKTHPGFTSYSFTIQWLRLEDWRPRVIKRL